MPSSPGAIWRARSGEIQATSGARTVRLPKRKNPSAVVPRPSPPPRIQMKSCPPKSNARSLLAPPAPLMITSLPSSSNSNSRSSFRLHRSISAWSLSAHADGRASVSGEVDAVTGAAGRASSVTMMP